MCPGCFDLFSNRSELMAHVVNKHNALLPVDNDSNSSKSLSSIEEMPWRTTRTMVDTPTNDHVAQCDVMDMKWQVGSMDVSDYLSSFRQQSIQHNARTLHKELSLTRILSIHHVFYFPLMMSKSCIAYLSDTQIQTVYDSLKSDPVTLPKDVVIWATNIQQAIDSGDRFALEREFGSILLSSSETRNGHFVDIAHIFISLTRTMAAHPKQPKRGAEDTFAHRFVAPFLNNIFYGNHLESLWANSQMAYAFHQASSSSVTALPSTTNSSYASISSFPPTVTLPSTSSTTGTMSLTPTTTGASSPTSSTTCTSPSTSSAPLPSTESTSLSAVACALAKT
ncbi:hypothetical protein DM01DRAFT_1409903 [Hesseltinella vesiculosa]|uniref:C2H2-type domain-containing protein n=1 Tax=Hesseltinella vesiculosa TaxID=101127 RepID=A0A1X2G931_9FUNG|nr:hypothetical protein DM01DRAFT_1409903 [Hesseltinella vesiculosa]